jgi:hypothetical protein
MARIIKLTTPDALFEKIKKEKEMFGYGSIQEVINEILRNKFFRTTSVKKSGKRGRPKKLDETRLITRHGRIFSDDGEPIQV